VHALLDVSRLLFSVNRAAPSGIDRVEMAYVRHWLARPEHACTFVVQSPWGWFAALPRHQVEALTDVLLEAWAGGTAVRDAARRRWQALAGLQAALLFGAGRAALREALARHRRPVFLLVSHRALDRAGPIAALRAAGAAFVPMIHDLIPLTHPEYARPAQVRRHARRVATTAALADGILVNSAATEASLAPRLAALGAAPPVSVAPLGLTPQVAAAPAPGAPYFVCLGTIEPRKNHLLLLHLWRALAAARGPDTPRLVLIGRRGWENENILDLLDRCEALRGLVQEMGATPDAEATRLLAGSRALLFPSFAEGFGLPLAEALALGVPAICSDLPALREVGGTVPDFLDPLDGVAWRRTVLDYARPDSPLHAAQLARMAGWRAPSWEDHFAVVDRLLEQVVSAPVQARRPARLPDPSTLVPEHAGLAAGVTAA